MSNPQPSLQVLIPGFDPTGLTYITQSQLLQLVQSALMASDKGVVITTEDDVDQNPTVPDARQDGAGTVNWQRCLWRRIRQLDTLIYLWDPKMTYDPIYFYWKQVGSISSNGSVATGSIDGSALVDDSIVGALKIAPGSISYDRLAPLPPWYNMPNSAYSRAGYSANAVGHQGDLDGNYPNPVIYAKAVTSDKLAYDPLDDSKRAVTNDHIKNLAIQPLSKLALPPVPVAKAFLRINAGNSALEFYNSYVTQMDNPVLGDAGKIMKVNDTGSGFQLTAFPTTKVKTYTKTGCGDTGLEIQDVTADFDGYTITDWKVLVVLGGVEYSLDWIKHDGTTYQAGMMASYRDGLKFGVKPTFSDASPKTYAGGGTYANQTLATLTFKLYVTGYLTAYVTV